MALATTKMSSKGQVVIPEELRQLMGLKKGARFVVVNQGDTLLFKVIPQPDPREFGRMLREARAQVKKAGVKKSDVTAAIREVRRQRSK